MGCLSSVVGCRRVVVDWLLLRVCRFLYILYILFSFTFVGCWLMVVGLPLVVGCLLMDGGSWLVGGCCWLVVRCL